MRLLLVVAAIVAVGCGHVAGGGRGVPGKISATVPGERGRLRVLDTFQTPASSTLVLEYVNDTGAEVTGVRLECVLIDARNEVVNVGSLTLARVQPGGAVTERLRIVDASQRAERAECAIAAARQVVP